MKLTSLIKQEKESAKDFFERMVWFEGDWREESKAWVFPSKTEKNGNNFEEWTKQQVREYLASLEPEEQEQAVRSDYTAETCCHDTDLCKVEEEELGSGKVTYTIFHCPKCGEAVYEIRDGKINRLQN